MPYIRVSPSALSSMSETLRNSSSKVGRIENDFSAIAGKLDWDVRAASDIQRRLNQITGELEDQTRRLDKMYVFIGNAQQKYSKVQNGTNSDGKKWNDGFILNPSSFKNIWDLLKLPASDLLGLTGARTRSSASSLFRNALGSAALAAKNSGTGKDAVNSKVAAVLERLKKSFSLKKLGVKAVASFGPVGSFAAALYTMYEKGKGGDWVAVGKEAAKSMVSWSKFTSSYKWVNYAKTNRFGSNYGTKNYAKRLFGLVQQTGSKAASWGSKFKANFKSGIKGTFVKWSSSSGSYKPNWFGIAGTVIDTAFNAYGNYKQVKAGQITADRAVVETIAETGANLLLGAAAGAIAAATLPATAPAALVAVASAGVMWAADGVTKFVTGGDKGLGELASEGVGWAYDQGKKIAKKAVEKGGEFFENLGKKVIGTSKACLSWIT